MHTPLDPFDPNTWGMCPPHEYRIYLDNHCNQWAIVDEIDYHWAIQWRWNIKTCRRNKLYARRSLSTYYDPVVPGERLSRKSTQTIYLHIEIMKRTEIAPPTENHYIVDHRNGNSLDCRRLNLRWATHRMNAKNKFGGYGYDLIEDASMMGNARII